jgi:hypothetical protein
MINLNKVLIHALAGALIGVLIGGIGARLAMRVVALITTGLGSFSAEGTLMILILFGLVGVVFALIFEALRGWLPGNRWWQGGSYGAIWALLFASFFFLSRDGEFGLLPPWLGALIFAPIPLLQGLALPPLLDWLTARWSSRASRLVSRTWFVLFVASSVLAFVGMNTLTSGAVRLPRAVSEWTGAASRNFSEIYEFHRLLGVIFVLVWCGLAGLLFVRRGDSHVGKLAALALMLFAAGWFNVGGMAAALFERTVWVDLLSWLLRAIGAGALVWLLVEIGRAYGNVTARQPLRPALAGVSIAVGWFVALWVATLFVPGLTLRDGNIFTPLAVTVYLLPWLALPIGLILQSQNK